MCSEPVTLGGGMTMQNAGRDGSSSGVNTPSSTQRRYNRASTDDGVYVVGRSRASGRVVMGPSVGTAADRTARPSPGEGRTGPGRSAQLARVQHLVRRRRAQRHGGVPLPEVDLTAAVGLRAGRQPERVGGSGRRDRQGALVVRRTQRDRGRAAHGRRLALGERPARAQQPVDQLVAVRQLLERGEAGVAGAGPQPAVADQLGAARAGELDVAGPVRAQVDVVADPDDLEAHALRRQRPGGALGALDAQVEVGTAAAVVHRARDAQRPGGLGRGLGVGEDLRGLLVGHAVRLRAGAAAAAGRHQRDRGDADAGACAQPHASSPRCPEPAREPTPNRRRPRRRPIVVGPAGSGPPPRRGGPPTGQAVFSRRSPRLEATSRGTRVGLTCSRTTSPVMTTRATSLRLGMSYITDSRTSSMIARSPRAPVPRRIAWSAIASSASPEKSRSTASSSNSRLYWRTSAFLGSVRMRMSASRSRLDTLVITGSRPTNSGIMPYLSRSSGMTSAKTSVSRTSFLPCRTARKPMAFLPIRPSMMRSSPAKAPPTMNRTFVVSIWMNSWCGCLRPPCGGTLAVVPSRIFSSACWTPSPETSRVIDGFSDLRAILSTSSM